MTVPRVMLLSANVPGTDNVSGLLLRELCQLYPKDNICCITVPTISMPLSDDLSWLPYDEIPSIQLPRLFGFGKHIYQLFPIMLVLIYLRLPLLIRRISQFGRKNKIDTVWIVLNSPIMILIARRVAKKLNARLLLTVMDPPETKLRSTEFDNIIKKVTLKEFENVLRNSVACGVASDNMAKEYSEQYGIEPVVLIHGVSTKNKINRSSNWKREKFIIGFAGTMYALDEYLVLLDALEQLDWNIDGKPISLRFLGKTMPKISYSSVNIEFMGWRSVEESVELISETDIAYLPYWFDTKWASSVRLCFPNKMSLYLAAGCPVLYHGPKLSSPDKFVRKYAIGFTCNSLDPNDLIETLGQFTNNLEFQSNLSNNIAKAVNNEISISVLRQRFADLIGISETELEKVDFG